MARQRYWVYMTSNKNRTVLYVGVTSNLVRRIGEHRFKVYPSFTKRYNVGELLYYELLYTRFEAYRREKQLKNWHRPWKLNLIKELNPEMRDLYNDIIKESTP